MLDLISDQIPGLHNALRVNEQQSLIFRQNEDIIVINEPVERAYVIRSGWACCHWQLSDGRRQILCFLLTGDMIGVLPLLNKVQEQRQCPTESLARTGYTVTALTRVEAVPIESNVAETAIDRFPGICRMLPGQIAKSTNEMLAIRLTTLGRCNARERMAVLFLELWLRQIALGVADETGFFLPINQTAIGDALGLTGVHVSRTFKKFEEDGILSATRDRSNRITVYNDGCLREIAAAATRPAFSTAC